MDSCHLKKKTHENANCLQIVCMSLFTEGVQNVHHFHGHMPGDAEMLSSLVYCIVDNVSRHISVQTVSFPKVMQKHTKGVVGKLLWILLEIYRSLQQRKNFPNLSRIDTVIAMVRVAHFC